MTRQEMIALVAAGVQTKPPSDWQPREVPQYPGPRPSRYCLDVASGAEDFLKIREAEDQLYETDDVEATVAFLKEQGLEMHQESIIKAYLDFQVWTAAYTDWTFEKKAQTEAAWRVEVARRIVSRILGGVR